MHSTIMCNVRKVRYVVELAEQSGKTDVANYLKDLLVN